MKELTIKEAIEQGYSKWGYADREWQTTQDIDDDIFDELEEGECPMLFEKEARFPQVNAEMIRDRIADDAADQDYQDSGRDDDAVSQAVISVDFTEITQQINKKLESCTYWMLTDIKLIK